MMDVSDGLLLDARRLADASECIALIDLDKLPLSAAFQSERGESDDARLFAATGGDDYALLAALPDDVDPRTIGLPDGSAVSAVGTLEAGGRGLRVMRSGTEIDGCADSLVLRVLVVGEPPDVRLGNLPGTCSCSPSHSRERSRLGGE